MIAGAHTIIFAEDAEAARSFFRDVLGFQSVDAGDGWLIFALPPGELALHPGPGWGRAVGQHELFFMCHDVEAAVEELERKGVEFVSPVADEGVGIGRSKTALEPARSLRLGAPREPACSPASLDRVADGDRSARAGRSDPSPPADP